MFSFSSRNCINEIKIYLSLLKISEYFVWFLFLFSKLGKGNSDFSFSSRNWRYCFQISLPLLNLIFLPFVNHWLIPTSWKTCCLLLHFFITNHDGLFIFPGLFGTNQSQSPLPWSQSNVKSCLRRNLKLARVLNCSGWSRRYWSIWERYKCNLDNGMNCIVASNGETVNLLP